MHSVCVSDPSLHCTHLKIHTLTTHSLSHTEWAYWELKEKEAAKQDWSELYQKLFDFSTVEEFHQCLMYQPKIS